MDFTGLIALATALATALAAHLKNHSQDSVSQQLRSEVELLKGQVSDCEEERKQLRELVEDKLNG